jgi:hypothetical protein
MDLNLFSYVRALDCEIANIALYLSYQWLAYTSNLFWIQYIYIYISASLLFFFFATFETILWLSEEDDSVLRFANPKLRTCAVLVVDTLLNPLVNVFSTRLFSLLQKLQFKNKIYLRSKPTKPAGQELARTWGGTIPF